MKLMQFLYIIFFIAILGSIPVIAQQTYGTKVSSIDPDVGLPLSVFSAVGGIPPQTQNNLFISFWDIGSTPGLYDDNDVPYLQFGSLNAAGQRYVQTNNIRLAGWESYPAGSYVKATDADMGMPLMVMPPSPPLPAGPQIRFYYMDVAGGAGYDMGDPVYLKVLSPPSGIGNPITAGTNDLRITANAGFPAGSRVSLNDPDAGKRLTPLKPAAGPAIPGVGGPFPSIGLDIASLMFFNANGNVDTFGNPIFDYGDVVYFHVGPFSSASVVSPNDIRMY